MASYDTTATTDVATDETGSLISASKVEGTTVYNRQGENLGHVYDVMIDKRSGQVAYAIMSFGGFLGMGDKLFAVPWSALTLDMETKSFILNVDKERLKNAPGFEKDDWPDMGAPEFGTRVHSFYNVTPYWE